MSIESVEDRLGASQRFSRSPKEAAVSGVITIFQSSGRLWMRNALSTQPLALLTTRVESFNDWGDRGCRKFVPVLGGDGTKIAPPGDIFDQAPGEMR